MKKNHHYFLSRFFVGAGFWVFGASLFAKEVAEKKIVLKRSFFKEIFEAVERYFRHFNEAQFILLAALFVLAVQVLAFSRCWNEKFLMEKSVKAKKKS